MRKIVALNEDDGNPRLEPKTALQFAKLAREQQYEYYWQEYPIDASFWVRFNWAFDIVSSFRLTGKCIAITITTANMYILLTLF